MGKRSDFKRMKGDLYITPPEAVTPLIAHLPARTRYCEPCAANGALISALRSHNALCVYASDIDPLCDWIAKEDVLQMRHSPKRLGATHYITNPPWTRKLLHAIILKLSAELPTWLLFDADWAHTEQAAPYLKHCRKVVSVGRVSWMGNGVTGKDNAAWYLFDQTQSHPNQSGPQFIGRDVT